MTTRDVTPSDLFGETPSRESAGVIGVNTGGGDGVWGVSVADRESGVGVHGIGSTYGVAAAGAAAGVYGEGVGIGAMGLYGLVLDDASIGVCGVGPTGVAGKTTSEGGEGVAGMVIDADDAWAVLGKVFSREGEGHGSYAGVFDGAVDVHGALTISGGGSVIDHPLDPANRVLCHAFVESSERKNVYDGVGHADDDGEIVVRLPAWLEAANADFRYQLTAIGAPARDLHVKEEVRTGRFVIGGAAPGQKVSWLLTATRKDPWAAAHPLVVEADKRVDDRGLYREPFAHGQPEERGAVFQRLVRRGRTAHTDRRATVEPAAPKAAGP